MAEFTDERPLPAGRMEEAGAISFENWKEHDMVYDNKKESQNIGSDETKASDNYAESRKDLLYYQVLRSLLKVVCREDDTICDVGSNGVDMLSFLPCREKTSIDLRRPYSDDKVTGVKADFLKYEFEKGGVDIITCFQVLEHINDEDVEVFAKKLLRNSRIAVVSVPYMWPKGLCKWHVQDPVDVEKFVSWFGVSPVFLYKVTEPKKITTRLIAVFVKGADGEIDWDYWRRDANAKLLEYKKKRSQRRIEETLVSYQHERMKRQ